MAVNAIQPPQTNLRVYVRSWDQRLRQTQTVAWLARAFVPGLMLGITIALISRLRPWLTVEQILLVTLAALLAGLAVLLGVVWLWPRSTLQIARRFDVDFGLKERVSTALEVAEGRIRAHDLLREPQAQDAVFYASQVNADQQLPFVINWREWGVAISLAAVLAILLILPNPQAEALDENAVIQEAIGDAEAEVRDSISNIAADRTLDEETRANLLENLEQSLETLQDDEITEEEAIATVSEAREMLSDEATGLQEQSQQQQAALEAAAQGLSEMQDNLDSESASSANGETGKSAEAAAETLENAANSIENMTQDQMNALAEQLENAAEALEQTAPEAAEAMRDAAEALREGDTEAAQQAMQEAADAMRDAQQQQQQQEQSSQNLQQSAQQLQAAQNNLQQQSQQQQSQPGQQQPDQNGSPPQDQQQGQPGDQSQQAPPQGQPPQSEQGQQQPSQSGQPGQTGNQSAQGDQPQEGAGAPQESGQPGDAEQGQSAGQSNDRGSQEAGTALGDLSADTSGAAQEESDVQGGGPPPGGERQYEQVFDPRQIDGPANTDSNIQLQADQSDIIRDEGQFAENDEGQVTVPYNQVFNDYANAANQAMNQSYIPLALRDVIRDYFLRLDPSGPDGS